MLNFELNFRNTLKFILQENEFFIQELTEVQVWSLSQVKVEFWSGYLKSKFLPWLGKNWDSKSRYSYKRLTKKCKWASEVKSKATNTPNH